MYGIEVNTETEEVVFSANTALVLRPSVGKWSIEVNTETEEVVFSANTALVLRPSKTKIIGIGDQLMNKSVKTTPVLILPNHSYAKHVSDISNASQYSQIDNNGNSGVSCVPKLSVHYIVSLNNEPPIISSGKHLDHEISSHIKTEIIDGERKCLISLPLDTSCHNDCDSNTLKANNSMSNQRLLISPTDFLTLTEDGITHKNSAVRKDVNLSASSLEIIRRTNVDTNFAICLDRLLYEDIKPSMETIDVKPVLTTLDPLETTTNNCSSQTQTDNTFSVITSQSDINVSTSQSLALTTLDIKVLPTGMLAKDSILLANLAAALPSSLTSRQIALQVIREDGTSLVLPLNTKHENNEVLSTKEGPSDLGVSTSVVLAEVVAPNESIRPFKCELCNSTFTRLGNYTRHKKIHSYPSKEDQRFRCDICSKSFIQRCDLARHLHIHRGTEPHRCSQCGKGYIRHSDLVTHQRFHNKEKIFSCPHCSKGFCQRGDLNRHLRSIHLQLKPILCSHCHKKFAKEETLLRHINSSHRDLIEDTTDPQFNGIWDQLNDCLITDTTMNVSTRSVSSIIKRKADNQLDEEINEDEPKKKTRDEWRKAKELEEMRKAGTAPALQDEEGRDINPHIPQYISSTPWYFGSEGPTLKHQRQHEEKVKDFAKIEDHFVRGLKGSTATRYRRGGCENCGAITHKKKDCLERPRKIGAKYSGEDFAADEQVLPDLTLDFDGKRDRWNGYQPEMYKLVIEEHEKIEDAKRVLKEEKLKQDLLNEEVAKEAKEGKDEPTMRWSRTRMTTKRTNTRITSICRELKWTQNNGLLEDTAKYLRNLDPESAFYDPKTRAMRENPYKSSGKTAEELQYAGDNFIRYTGDTNEVSNAQLFAWQAMERGLDIHLQAEPTKTELVKKQIDDKKVNVKEVFRQSIIDKYGGKEHLQTLDPQLKFGQTDSYVEYSRRGQVIKGCTKPNVSSIYEEDVFVNKHTAVWGSFWDNGQWGYKCCQSVIKNAYCTGDKNKIQYYM
ncbi:unnamed protein product [Medioppia subpectinata]|uniref:Pre-mRNA-splicing factor SLU7 n=1 Tax=Medioppia subpectinata TaxID=1979941 RepID=A0A7R9KR91_9ACAR|nr:unnamed protein product [Medioppia subpectinata]CAG2106976.1 unnamed protein product [Medioppia subpectinata]